MLPTQWHGSDATAALKWPAPGSTAHGTYRITGDLRGTPRVIAYSYNGEWWRARRADTGDDVWISGPDGTYWEFGTPAGPYYARHDTTVVFGRPLLPELTALAGIDALMGWLSVPVHRSPTQPDKWTGHTGDSSRILDVTTDRRTGLVTAIRMTGTRTLFLETDSLELTATGLADFSYDGPTRIWDGPTAGPHP